MASNIDRMRAVFLAALEKTPTAERAAFLDEACRGDDRLRQDVEALLRAHHQADPLFDRPATELLGGTSSGRSEPDDSLDFLDAPSRAGSLGRLGHYEVLEILGRGGFGIVFRAYDESLQRVVAV